MIILEGCVEKGVGNFRPLMNKYPDVFKRVTEEALYPETLNVKVDNPVQIEEHFRIIGADIGMPQQDLLFEKCFINGSPAFRIRPYELATGLGGHGDNVLEIARSQKIPNASFGSVVKIEFFRDESGR